MFKKVFVTSLCFLFLLLNSIGLKGQPPTGPMVVSPKINTDKTVTFSYLAPKAKEVMLSGQFEKKPVSMKKDSIGIWSVTVGPIEPDIYPYNFIVDGLSVMDPANVDYFPNERFKGSLLDVPGDTPLIHSMQDVPHGKITYEYYPSVKGTTGSLVVYTPPGYEKNPSKKYPVFYLISGTTDTEEDWYKVGRTNFIMDNLIAQGKAVPMIIVMPYGNIEARIAEQTGGAKPEDPSGRENKEAVTRALNFSEDMINNIIPYIEKNYNVISDKNSRAIGGFSRGGGQTLRTAFGNMDKFGSICCFSAYLSTQEMEAQYKNVVDNPEKTNKDLKLLWISVGNEDFLYKQTEEFMGYLKGKNINYKSLVTTGGHTWMNTKKFLNASVQLLFK
ncbi:MAG: esterase [Ignavibacteria bacterium]|nr:esterase [Ignavibacteria bacterium]